MNGFALVTGGSRGIGAAIPGAFPSRPLWSAAAVVVSLAATPALAQTVQEVKDAFEMMLSSAAICADYLKRPEVLTEMRGRGGEQLALAGMPGGEASAFMDGVIATAQAETTNVMQQQVACEIINIKAIP
jgi:hypothetical protein